jgi:uncharacterized membrane protein
MVTKSVIDKLTALMISAFSLVAALAWNDAIKAMIKDLNLSRYGPWFYAVIVTLIAVVMAVYLGKVSEKVKEVDDKLIEHRKKVREKVLKKFKKKSDKKLSK